MMAQEKNSYCIVIPCYNHGHFIRHVIERLLPSEYPIIIIDDASDRQTHDTLLALKQQYDLILHRHPKNLGKGAALKTALYLAEWHDFSHIIQIDADGQHDLSDLDKFITLATQEPDSLISGQPVYDQSVPKIRYYGRYLTHIWVWLETLSCDIKDSLCGFRVYPVEQTLSILRQVYTGNRMEFDIEIMVQYYWRYGRVRFIPTHVMYPPDGVSHFDQIWDNLRLSKMHIRLLCQMICFLPSLISRKKRI